MARRAYQGRDDMGIYTGKLPRSLGFLVVDLVADYDRREEELRRSRMGKAILRRYDDLNRAIDGAIDAVYRGEIDAAKRAMRRDIARRRGYLNCESKQWMSEGMFYRRKKWCKREIAERMGWI